MELNIERQKNEMLMNQLREKNKIVKSYELSSTPGKYNNCCLINKLIK